jgi:hypothetical protein
MKSRLWVKSDERIARRGEEFGGRAMIFTEKVLPLDFPECPSPRI